MITIGTVRFNLECGDEPFAQELYGRWDSFSSISFEKVVDDVLSRYDTEDEEIIIESLDLDLGEIEEDGFYEQFPTLLARKLDDVFSSYLWNKDGHPGQISIIPMRQSRLSKFIYFMTHGWWQWTREEETLRVADLLDALIEESPSDLYHFFWENGSNVSVRQRLVLQFNDPALERLVEIMIPSDAAFINIYVGFVRTSFIKLNRPDIAANDFRNAVWSVVWAYLLTESKGYFSRKQLIIRTLTRLSASFNLSMRTLLEMLTFRINELSAIRQVMPDLLVILAEISKESLSKPDAELPPDFLGVEELRALLSQPDSARIFLNRLAEELIYKVTERIFPAESPFIVHYAQTLDREKARGMLEGRAGEEFRIVKWVFIFQVLFHESGSRVERKQFVWSVLKRLSSHYNLNVIDLLGYFYRTLVAEGIAVRPELRELVIALYMDALEESPEKISFDFPHELTDTLSNVQLCHRFLLPLREEEIYPIVRKVIPAESAFIIDYARTLDKGKEQGMLEGKAGTEFRVLKWEFIFLVVFSAPVSAFSRKQFTRSVLSRLAAHYNLSAYELIAYFYKGAQEKEGWIPEDIRLLITDIYEDMLRESPEPILAGRVDEARMVSLLENFVVKGQIPRAGSVDSVKVFACLLRWAVELYGSAFDRKAELLALLRDLMVNGKSADVAWLRKLIVYCVKKQTDLFERQLDVLVPRKSAVVPSSGNPVAREDSVSNTLRPAVPTYPFDFYSRQVVEGLVRLLRRGGFGVDEAVWLECISGLMDRNYRNLSKVGLLSVFWQRLSQRLSVFQLQEVKDFVIRHEDELPSLFLIIQSFFKRKDLNMSRDLETGVSVAIPNAGLILIGPFCPMLFSRMGLLDDSRRNFKDKDSQVKAIFALQSLVSDQAETPECDLVLNKLLTHYENEEPLPRSYSFDQKEIELLEMFKKSILMNWDKMRNTSWRGFRDTFLARAGKLEKTEDYYTLTVSEKPIDVLLDTVPWGFKLLKYPWMPSRLIVKWR